MSEGSPLAASESRVLPPAIAAAEYLAANGQAKLANDVRALIRSFRASVRTNQQLHQDNMQLRRQGNV